MQYGRDLSKHIFENSASKSFSESVCNHYEIHYSEFVMGGRGGGFSTLSNAANPAMQKSYWATELHDATSTSKYKEDQC